MKAVLNGRVGCFFFFLFLIGATLFSVFHFVQTPQKQPLIVAPTASPSPNPNLDCHGKESSYETGLSVPEWGENGYSQQDNNWETEILSMQKQTGACWIEMPILFYQSSDITTDVQTGSSTPTLNAFAQGLHYAHEAGLKIFVTFLLGTGYQSDPWDGKITLPTFAEQQAWFIHYFQTIQPYLQIAQQQKVEQLAMGTEEKWLQNNASSVLWTTLLQNIRGIYTGILTYDANWDTLFSSPPDWFKSNLLSFIGISSYVPVINASYHVDPIAIPNLWKQTVLAALDSFAQQLGEPVLISEIGYRQASDALYQPWDTVIRTTKDTQEQAAACGAAIENTEHDPNIRGIFFWGWGTGVGGMNLAGTPAAQTIASFYTQL